ncbi:MAG: hypothetical protein ACC656_05085, partial [Candidatus Heimdallarchaeota archaeon]
MKNKHIILFEGPDRCGKTKIAKELAKILNLEYFKNFKEQINFTAKNTLDAFRYETHYLLQLLQNVKFGTNGIVLDRHFPSEYVYAHAYDRETDDHLVWWFDTEFAKLGTKLIYCYKSKYKKFDDEVIKLEEIKNIRNQYETQYLP